MLRSSSPTIYSTCIFVFLQMATASSLIRWALSNEPIGIDRAPLGLIMSNSIPLLSNLLEPNLCVSRSGCSCGLEWCTWCFLKNAMKSSLSELVKPGGENNEMGWTWIALERDLKFQELCVLNSLLALSMAWYWCSCVAKHWRGSCFFSYLWSFVKQQWISVNGGPCACAYQPYYCMCFFSWFPHKIS